VRRLRHQTDTRDVLVNNAGPYLLVGAFAPSTAKRGAGNVINISSMAGYLNLDSAKFHDSFAADVDTEKAAFMADSQVPCGVAALNGAEAELSCLLS
jgi:hypothetical protein